MQKTALLVGGSGQIGIASARRLLSLGYDVTIAHRGTRPLPHDLVGAVAAITVDRSDTDALARAVSGHDLVLDCIAYAPRDAEVYRRVVGDLASLVVISTASVYLGSNGTWVDIATGPDDFPKLAKPVTEQHPTVTDEGEGYSTQKAALERALLGIDGLPVTVLRPGAVHGPESAALREWYFIKRALDGRRRVPLTDMGESRFATTSTAVIAELVRLAAEHPAARILNAADDPGPTALEIGQAVFAYLGHEAEFELLPRTLAGEVGQHPWAVAHPVVLSVQAARDELGYSSVGTHRSTIGPAIEWMLGEVADADWRERFPALAERYGASSWFDYEAEDALLGA